MAVFIELEVTLAKLGASGQRYDVWHDGELLVAGTRAGIFDAARALVELGADLEDVILIRRQGSPTWDMRGRVGWLIGRTVSEGDSQGPHIINWSPYSGPGAE